MTAKPQNNPARTKRGVSMKRKGEFPFEPSGRRLIPEIRSIMRRTLVLGRLLAAGPRTTRAGSTFAKLQEFLTQSPDFVGKLEHRLVLLRHVPLEISDLFLEAFNGFVQRSERATARQRRPAPPAVSSGQFRE